MISWYCTTTHSSQYNHWHAIERVGRTDKNETKNSKSNGLHFEDKEMIDFMPFWRRMEMFMRRNSTQEHLLETPRSFCFSRCNHETYWYAYRNARAVVRESWVRNLLGTRTGRTMSTGFPRS